MKIGHRFKITHKTQFCCDFYKELGDPLEQNMSKALISVLPYCT